MTEPDEQTTADEQSDNSGEQPETTSDEQPEQ
ncbi:hypothetical protein HDA40_005458 [Hamadaea flava]|nr:hypothetical protein [Hamadaea flava]